MRLSGAAILIYVAGSAGLLWAFLAHSAHYYTAQRPLAFNHRVAHGDFDPDPSLDNNSLFLKQDVHTDQRIGEDAFALSPIATPAKGNVSVGFGSAILPKDADAGDTLSVCRKDGRELAAVTLSAIECGAGMTPPAACGVLIEAKPNVAAKLLSRASKSQLMSFSTVGSCTASVSPKGRRTGHHAHKHRNRNRNHRR